VGAHRLGRLAIFGEGSWNEAVVSVLDPGGGRFPREQERRRDEARERRPGRDERLERGQHQVAGDEQQQ
jgi:hypothetical protein